MKKITIESERLQLKTIDESHTEFIVNLRNNKENRNFFKKNIEITIESHNEWYKNCYLNNDKRYDFVVRLKDSKINIGTCTISNLNEEEETAELGYVVSCEYRRKGYAKEAVCCLMNFACSNWNVHKFLAVIHKDNLASISFVENLNFVKLESENEFIKYVFYK